MKRVFIVLFSAVLFVAFSSCGNKGGSKPQPVEEEVVKIPEVKVYCNAFDGFFNMREKPTLASERIGKFYNGPKGAVVLDDDEEKVEGWIKVNANGIIGYVHEAYVQDTPTEAYTGDVDPEWVQGGWCDDPGSLLCDILFLYDSGVWALTSNGDLVSYGLYRVQKKNEIRFVTAWCEDREFPEVLTFDVSEKLLGGMYMKINVKGDDADVSKAARAKFYAVAAQIKAGSHENLLEKK